MVFERDAIERVGEKWADIEKFNDSLDRLRMRRIAAIEREGIAGQSKVIWKINVFKQLILYRIVMLADGCSAAWNAHNPLTSVLCARAAMETSAIILDFEAQLARYCEKENFAAIDDLITNYTFSTRLKDWVESEAGTKATNILNIIDRLDKAYPGTRRHYERLSEMCHPNYLGHWVYFASLDVDADTVHLSDNASYEPGIFNVIAGGIFIICLVETSMDRIDELFPKILQLSEADRRN